MTSGRNLRRAQRRARNLAAFRPKSIMNALDPERLRGDPILHLRSRASGSPRPILPEPGRQSRDRRRVSGAARDVRRRRHDAGAAGAGRSAVRGRGRPRRPPAAMDKESHQAAVCANAACRWSEYDVVRTADALRSWTTCCALRVSDVREAGESGLVGGHLEGEDASRAGGGARDCRAVRSQGARRAGDHRAGVRVLRAGQRRSAWRRPPARFCPRASSTITKTSICWTSAKTVLPARSAGADGARCSAWRSPASRRWTARAWRASISCWRPRPASSISTRSTPFRASRPSACIRRCGSSRGCRFAELLDRLIDLALERHARASHALLTNADADLVRDSFALLRGACCAARMTGSRPDTRRAREELRGSSTCTRSVDEQCRRPGERRHGALPGRDSGDAAASSIRTRSSSIRTSSSSCSRCRRERRRDSAPSSACCRAA